MTNDEAMIRAGFLNTAVNLYFDPGVLDRDVARLRDAGYHVAEADASGWLFVADVHRDLSRMFNFPEYYGHNWDAFNDCLGEYGWPAEASGLVMVLTGFDAFVVRFPDAAHVLLDICALRQRDALIAGNHLICLVQSDDPRLTLVPVGATVPQWNRDEWFDRDRGLRAD
jgi:hypothetical protein